MTATLTAPARTRTRAPLTLAAMIFAVGVLFIDQTIVAIAIPAIRTDLGLTNTGAQWVVNAYLLALAALFAFGGKLSDVLGPRRMVLVGVIGFACASALCGAAPSGAGGEAWLIAFRVLQGAFAAVLFPSALAIIAGSVDKASRGKALATFFGITGALTAVGPIAGGALVTVSWRAIFWVNLPIALIAVILTLRADITEERRPTPIDFRGTVLAAAGMGLLVLGLQQTSVWGWWSPAMLACVISGALLLVAFVAWQRRAAHPLIDLGIFRARGFQTDTMILLLVSVCFVPLFFFMSIYSQLVLGEDAYGAGLYVLTLFGGFAAGSQIGGRMLDKGGARKPILLGTALGAVGFYLWSRGLVGGDLNTQWHWIVLAGIGLGLSQPSSSTDALNQAPRGSYGEVSGITQTIRYLGSALGMAVFGTLLLTQNKSGLETSLGKLGVPAADADHVAATLTSGPPTGTGSHVTPAMIEAVQHTFAQSCATVFVGMAAVMAASFVVAVIRLRTQSVTAGPEAPSTTAR